MQEFMETYNTHENDIEKCLIETIHNLGDLNSREKENFKKLYDVFPSLELVYICNKETLIQTSSNIYRDKESQAPKGRDRAYMLTKVNFNSTDISISKPYINSATGTTCITVAKKEKDFIYF